MVAEKIKSRTSVEELRHSDSEQKGDAKIEKSLEIHLNAIMEKVSKVAAFLTSFLFLAIIFQSEDVWQYVSGSREPSERNNCLWIAVGVVYSYSLKIIANHVLVPLLEPYLTKKITKHGESTADRLDRIGSALQGAIYYFISTIVVGYYGYGSEYFPQFIGGRAPTLNTPWLGLEPRGLHIYFLLEAGHHVERLLYHAVTQTHSHSFWTMMWHHILASTVILIACFTEHSRYAILLIFFHDISDMLLYLTRVLRETPWTRLGEVSFVTMFLSWIFLRTMGLFVYHIPNSMYNIRPYNNGKVTWTFRLSNWFAIGGLSCLAVLNIYWIFQIGRIAITHFVKKEKEHPMEDAKDAQKTKK